MSDKFSVRTKRLNDATRKIKERFLVLTSLEQEGFTPQDTTRFFQANDQVILAVYTEYVKSLDLEADTAKAPRVCTPQELIPLAHVLRNLIMINCDKISKTGWEIEALEQEVCSFLNADNHLSVKRLGLELLLHFTDAVHAAPTAKDNAECIFERARVMFLLSAFDWEQFRSGLDVTLPNSIVPIKGTKKHKSFPLSVRNTSAVDEERMKEATDGVKVLFDHITACHGEPHRLRNWWLVFRSHFSAIVYPRECFSSGAISEQRWDGFSVVPPKTVHALTVQFLSEMAASPAVASCTVLGSEIDCKFTVTVCSITPSVVPVSDKTSIPCALALLQRWIEKPDLAVHVAAVVNDPLSLALDTEDVRTPIVWLCESCTAGKGAIAQKSTVGSLGPLNSIQDAGVSTVISLVHQFEMLVHLLRSIVVNAHGLFKSKTQQAAMKHLSQLVLVAYATIAHNGGGGSATDPTTTGSGWAAQNNASVVSNASVVNSSVVMNATGGSTASGAGSIVTPSGCNLLPLYDTLEYLCQSYWDSVYSLCPPGTEMFGDEVLSLCVVLTPMMRTFTQAPYFHRCWMSNFRQVADNVIHVAGRKERDPFKWPPRDQCYESSSELSHYRGSRWHVPGLLLYLGEHKELATAFQIFSDNLHTAFGMLTSDAPAVSVTKGRSLCKSVDSITQAVEKDLVVVEPNSLLSLLAPYLIICSTLEDPQAPKAVMSTVAVEAYEVMAGIVAMPSSNKTGIANELFVAVMNSLAAGLQVNDAPIEMVVRVIVRLFPGNLITTSGTPTPSIMTERHCLLPTFEDLLYETAERVLGLTHYRDESTLMEAKVSALVCKLWQVYWVYHGAAAVVVDHADGKTRQAGTEDATPFTRRSEGVYQLVADLVARTTAHRYPKSALIRVLTYVGLTELHLVPSFAQCSIKLLGLVFDTIGSLWSSLNEKHSLMLYSSHVALTEAVVTACKGEPLPDEFIELYCNKVTQYIAAAMFHLTAWESTRASGTCFLHLLRTIGEMVTRIGYLSHQACSQLPGIPLVQLFADLIAYCRYGQSTLRYCIALPQTHQLMEFVHPEDDNAEDAVQVPAPDGKTWFPPTFDIHQPNVKPPVPTSRRQQSPQGSPRDRAASPPPAPLLQEADVMATAVELLNRLLHVVGNEEVRYPVTAPFNPNGHGFASNRSTGLSVVGDRDTFSVHSVGSCGEMKWHAKAEHGYQDSATWSAEDEAKRSALEGKTVADCFAPMVAETNDAMDVMLEDFATSSIVVPRGMDVQCDFAVEDDTQRAEGLLAFTPAVPTTRPELTTASSAIDFFSSLGMFGLGDTFSKTKVHSGGFKPQYFFTQQNMELLSKAQEVHPVAIDHVAVSCVVMEGESGAKCAELRTKMVQCLGWNVDSCPGVNEYTSPGHEVSTTILEQVNMVAGIEIPVHIICCQSFTAVRCVHSELRRRQRGTVPCSMIYAVPSGKSSGGESAAPDSVILFTHKQREVPMVPVLDGMVVPASCLGSLLHPVIRVASEAFLKQTPHTTTHAERTDTLLEPQLGVTDQRTYESLLGQLAASKWKK